MRCLRAEAKGLSRVRHGVRNTGTVSVSYRTLLTEGCPKTMFSFQLVFECQKQPQRERPPRLGGKASSPSLEGYSMSVLTFATKIRWTGSESSNTTNPKLGSFPPTPLVLMRSSTTFPKPGRTRGKSHVIEKPHQQSHPFTHSRQRPQRFGPQRIPWVALSDHYVTFQRGFPPQSLLLNLLLTHEELLQLTLIDVVRQVPNEELVAVWVANYSTVI